MDPAEWTKDNLDTVARLLALHRESEHRLLDRSPAQRLAVVTQERPDAMTPYVERLGAACARLIDDEAKRLADVFDPYPTGRLTERLRAIQGPLRTALGERGTPADVWVNRHRALAARDVAIRRVLAGRAQGLAQDGGHEAPGRDRAAGNPAQDGPAQGPGIGV